RGGRPKGIAEHPNSRAARLEGRRRWVERMRVAKEAGLIEKFPNGSRRSRGLSPLAKDRNIQRAQRIIDKKLEVMEKQLPAPDKSWEQMSNGEQLQALARIGLRTARDVLALGVNPDDPRVLKIVSDVALTSIAQQIRIEER